MGDQHGGQVSAAVHARPEGQKVGGFEGLQWPLVHGDAGVGIHIIAVAREVL